MKKNLSENNYEEKPYSPSRRDFLKTCGLGTAVITFGSILGKDIQGFSSILESGSAGYRFSMNQNWLFGGKLKDTALQPNYNDSDFTEVTLPHCVSNLSWQKWDPAEWQDVWIYRKHFDLPVQSEGRRVFINFDGVMVGVTPVINGHSLPEHLGGYLPVKYEITDFVKKKDNVVAVVVDSRWSDVPPQGSPLGSKRVDYLEPGGIYRSVNLEIVPQIYIADIFAKPVDVLSKNRKLEVKCSVDSAEKINSQATVEVELRKGKKIIDINHSKLNNIQKGENEITIILSDLKNVKLWDIDEPNLYDVKVTLIIDDEKVHDFRTRTGFREARFDVNGFYLNGRKLRLFGLNRHELYPYVGYAMPERVIRHDAEIIKNLLNCNSVRCSHYPQNKSFFDACDEFGLLVWEEVPGWQYLGDESWKNLLMRDTEDMIIRDRNHPSIIIWGVRANESPNDPVLYRRTKEIAKTLDDSRPTSGSMTPRSTKTWEDDWHQDVFAYDDYHAEEDGSVGIFEPLPGVPYMLAEAVGQFNYKKRKMFDSKYRRAGDLFLQQNQALYHAKAHSKAAEYDRMCGVIAWCAFDYGSEINSYDNVKTPGVVDIFRIPKLGASFYMAQVDPKINPVIIPNFYWDFSKATPEGPGKKASIFSNCQRLDLHIDGEKHSTLKPDFENFPNIKYPPFFADLEFKNDPKIELRIDGFVDDKLILSKTFSADEKKDDFYLHSHDKKVIADGSDLSRVEFFVGDKYGTPRLYGAGEVKFNITGPGILVGDNPFILDASGGLGAVWIKTLPNKTGKIILSAEHSKLGKKTIEINVEPDKNPYPKV